MSKNFGNEDILSDISYSPISSNASLKRLQKLYTKSLTSKVSSEDLSDNSPIITLKQINKKEVPTKNNEEKNSSHNEHDCLNEIALNLAFNMSGMTIQEEAKDYQENIQSERIEPNKYEKYQELSIEKRHPLISILQNMDDDAPSKDTYLMHIKGNLLSLVTYPEVYKYILHQLRSNDESILHFILSEVSIYIHSYFIRFRLI
jgi:hypothetical protein